MSGLFQLLGLGSGSLAAAQYAQATAGNNVANAATPGFSRRRVTLVEAPPIRLPVGAVGTGVLAAGLARLREGLLDTQWRLDSEDLQFASARARVLEQVGALFGPADTTALGTALNRFFDALGDLAGRPEDLSVRAVVLTEAQAVASAFGLLRDQVESVEQDVSATVADRVAEVNGLSARIAALNGDLTLHPDDASLADERDRLIDRLAELIGVRAATREDGTVQVLVNGTGIQLVDGLRAAVVSTSGTPIGGAVSLAIDGMTLGEVGGEIGGLLSLRNSTTEGLPWALDRIDEMARGLIAGVNREHASGSGLALASSWTATEIVTDPAAALDTAGLWHLPVAGTLALGVFDGAGTMVSSSSVAIDPATMSLDDLAAALDALPDLSASVTGGRLVLSTANPAHRLAFGQDSSDILVALGINGLFTGTDAHTLAASPALLASPSLVATARADLTAGRVSPGDASAASAMAALRASTFLGSGQTPAQFLGTLGGDIGAAARSAAGRVETLETVVRVVDEQRQAISGVNVDEELAEMVRYQRAYEASARFIRTVDDMIGALMDIL